MYKTDLASKST